MKNDPIDDLFELNSAINQAFRDKNPELANKLFEDLYVDLIVAQGFTEKQASIISYQAYERGHSSGIGEIVNLTHDLIDFAKQILAHRSK